MKPGAEFNQLQLSPELVDTLGELGFQSPTPIQAKAVPLLLQGKDLVARSKTGSGKTAAFTLPILEKLDTEFRALQALVIVPTRELATQVTRDIRVLGRRIQALRVLMVVGGQPIRPQIEALQEGVHIVVATPGRLVDLIRKEVFQNWDLQTLVLDEADQMLDMGFEDDMRTILEMLPEGTQKALFSATYPDAIKSIARSFLTNPVHVTIEQSPADAPAIEHSYFTAETEEKTQLLLTILRRHDPEAALVFCNLKATSMQLQEELAREGFSAAVLNGDLEQRDRDEVMAKFRNGSVRILIATDVAARGLDIKGLPMVINYDLPRDLESYVHRAGRTGRAGATGVALSLVAADEMVGIGELESFTHQVFTKGLLPAKNPGARPRAADMQTLFVGGGRKDKVRPGDLLGALTGEAGRLEAAVIGKIEIHDRFSYVAVRSDLAPLAYRSLSNGRIKGQKFHVKLLS